jgi:transposase
MVETCAEAFGVADVARELGHDPRVVPATLAPAHWSSEKKQRTAITKAGSPRLRWALIQGARATAQRWFARAEG